MPFQPSILSGEQKPPTPEPHLGVQLQVGTVAALPQGAVLHLIMDPTKPDGVEPMALIKVTKHALYLRCPCGKTGCTRTITFRITRKGQHPQEKE